MQAGRKALRDTDARNQAAALEVARSFGEDYDPMQCSMIAIHDDCVARRFYGHPPSPCVDVALCDTASREAACEARAAFAGGGVRGAKLSAGRLCDLISRTLADASATASAPPREGPGPIPRLTLLSGHDTSLIALIHALEAGSGGQSGSLVPMGEWPPHTSSVAVELLDDGHVRVLYQFETVLTQPLDRFLAMLEAISSSEEEHHRLCGEAKSDGMVFRWNETR